MEISVGNMKKRSIFKLGFFALLTIYVPLFLIMGIAGALGYDTVTMNGGNIYGVAAIFVTLIFCIIFSALGSLFFTLGAWILGKIGPNSVSIKSKDNATDVGTVFE